MSLRTDIHSAYDEIAPPVPQLEAQIRALASTGAKTPMQTRGRRGPWVASLRGTMALVAALLVVLVVATVLVGGRVWQDWNVFTNRPAPAGQIDQAALAALEARPLHLPAVNSLATCPAGPITNIDDGNGTNSVYGDGPVYGVGGGSTQTSWGWYFDVTFETEPQLTGLVLVRARDAVNHDVPVVYVGQYAAGAVIGTDTINGKRVVQRAEMVIDAGRHPTTSGKSKWGIYRVRQGVESTRWSDCTAFQIDGQGFSKVFVA